MNRPNKGEQSSAEAGEGRARTKENIAQSNTSPTQSGERVSQGLNGVRQAARERKQARFTALLHHMNVDLFRQSFLALKRQAAPGIDGVTWKEHETGLEDRLADLHSRIHRGGYRAQASRRVYIPKADGRQRPLGVAALEDKIVQQAVVTILNEIYEVDFQGFSYGFRPGRSPHKALDALSVGLHRKRVNWVLDADIRGFFDHMSHEWTVKFRPAPSGRSTDSASDPEMVEGGGIRGRPMVGDRGRNSSGGAVISPLLADIYLHYVFDLWIEVWRRKVAKGDVIVVRYADDLVVGFEYRAEAERFWRNSGNACRSSVWNSNSEKTRLIEFGRFAAQNRERRGEGKPETFTFLGFTHYCGKLQNGTFTVWRETANKRMVAKLQSIRSELRRRRLSPSRALVNG